MKNILLRWQCLTLLSTFLISENLYCQGLYNNGAQIVITDGSYLYLDGTNGNYTSTSGGIITNSSGSNIIIEGNWLNNSSNIGFANNGSTVTFSGASQTIEGSSSTTFYDFIGNGSGTITLHKNTLITHSFYLGTDQKLAINDNTLTIDGTISGTGKLIGSNASNIAYTGNVNGTLYFDQTIAGTSNLLNNLSYDCNGGILTLGNSLNIYGLVIPTSGQLATGNNLTLKSSSNQSAFITQGSGTYLTGNISVEKYIPASVRRFRFISSPVSGASLNGLIDDIFITGNSGLGGFDVTGSNSPSSFLYNESLITGNADIGWEALSDLSYAFTAGRGYRIYIRGDRSDPARLTGVNTTQNEVTIDLTGGIHSGDISPNFMTLTNSGVAANDGWNFMGNPYASNLDWNAMYDGGDFTNVDPTIYQRDAINGNYKSFNASSNSGTGSSIINSFAGFMVQFTGTPGATFKESRKVSTQGPNYFKAKLNELIVKMVYDSFNSDELLIHFISNGNGIYNRLEDSKKLMNENVNIFSQSLDVIPLCTDLRNTDDLKENLTIPITVKGPIASYKLTFAGLETFAENKLYMEDKFLSKTLELTPNTPLEFSITSNELSKENRFFLRLEPNVANGNSELFSTKNNIQLFPNPANNLIHLGIQHDVLSGEFRYHIKDHLGRTVLTGNTLLAIGKSQIIQLNNIPAGYYFIEIENSTYKQVSKFLKY